MWSAPSRLTRNASHGEVWQYSRSVRPEQFRTTSGAVSSRTRGASWSTATSSCEWEQGMTSTGPGKAGASDSPGADSLRTQARPSPPSAPAIRTRAIAPPISLPRLGDYYKGRFWILDSRFSVDPPPENPESRIENHPHMRIVLMGRGH